MCQTVSNGCHSQPTRPVSFLSPSRGPQDQGGTPTNAHIHNSAVGCGPSLRWLVWKLRECYDSASYTRRDCSRGVVGTGNVAWPWPLLVVPFSGTDRMASECNFMFLLAQTCSVIPTGLLSRGSHQGPVAVPPPPRKVQRCLEIVTTGEILVRGWDTAKRLQRVGQPHGPERHQRSD